MEVSSDSVVSTQLAEEHQTHEIDWDAYASQYDLLAKYNPSYRENIELLRSMLKEFDLGDEPAICDIGAGTGNYICALAKDIPGATFCHVDADQKMNAVAKSKYAASGVKNVEVHGVSALDADFETGSFDLIVCVNALYAIHPPEELLRRARLWLKPTGVLFVIDFGRRARMWDWSKYIFGSILREHGVLETVRFFVNGMETIRQNRRGSKGQAEGVYWLHSTEEFEDALVRAGYSIERVQTCYRGYCDLAVCRPTFA